MTIQEFIDDHRGELDTHIRRVLSNPNVDLDDGEREWWIANDEGLYSWAQGEGVDDDDDA